MKPLLVVVALMAVVSLTLGAHRNVTHSVGHTGVARLADGGGPKNCDPVLCPGVARPA